MLTDQQVQQFICDHEHDDERALVLKHKTVYGIPSALIANQLASRRKAKEKLPLWYATPGIVYPPSLNLEQSSSEATARYKAEIISKLLSLPTSGATEGGVGVDLTGGFGVDSFFLNNLFKSFHHVEPNQELIEIVQHNHRLLGATNISYHSSTAGDFLKSSVFNFDLIFIDPSRRSSTQKRILRFTECQPDVIHLLPNLFKITNSILIKASPLLDIQKGIQELLAVSDVFVVSVDNDCKEALFLCRKDFSDEPYIHTINLDRDADFSFYPSQEKEAIVKFSDPLTYLYEPNASILKSGAFKLIGTKFNLFKLHRNTHLYTSEKEVAHFPGRIFKLEAIVKRNELKKLFPERKANIIARNYPLSTDEIRKSSGLKEGGEKYLLALTGPKKKYLIAAARIK